MRTVLAVAALLLAPAALAQVPAEQAVQQDPSIKANQTPESSPQGTRATQSNSTDTKTISLTEALDAVWQAPVDLQGNPIPLPSPLSKQPPPANDKAGGPNP
jgi:uncharacterized protein YdeI (BOF family)